MYHTFPMVHQLISRQSIQTLFETYNAFHTQLCHVGAVNTLISSNSSRLMIQRHSDTIDSLKYTCLLQQKGSKQVENKENFDLMKEKTRVRLCGFIYSGTSILSVFNSTPVYIIIQSPQRHTIILTCNCCAGGPHYHRETEVNKLKYKKSKKHPSFDKPVTPALVTDVTKSCLFCLHFNYTLLTLQVNHTSNGSHIALEFLAQMSLIDPTC